MASNSIVQVAVSQVQAPIPETLQQTGAIVSVGGTLLAPGASQVLTQLADLTAILRGAQPLASISYSGGTATATTVTSHDIPVGQVFELTIAGAVPTAYNGTYFCEATDEDEFIYHPTQVPSGSATTPGGYTPEDVTELIAQVTTVFSQGSAVAPYVLELGLLDTDDAIASLAAYIAANPNTEYVPGASGFYYVYLVPEAFDGRPSYLSLLTQYNGTQAQTYFVTTSKLSTYKLYTDLQKSAIVVIPTPQLENTQQTAVLSVAVSGYTAEAVDIFSPQSGSGSYAPADVLTVVGGTGTAPTFTVTNTQVMSAVVASGGADGTPGPVVVTGTTGTGTKFTATGTINGDGELEGDLSVTLAGDYTVNPTSLSAEPVTGGSLTGATVTLVMGVLQVSLTTPGAMMTIPEDPVATTVAPSGGTGCQLIVLWAGEEDGENVATATLINATSGIDVGDWFQLVGFTPASWNGWWQAIAGSSGNTILFEVPVDIDAVTDEGFVAGNVATSNGPGATEFQAAGVFYDILATKPSPTNRAAPFSFRYQFGVTPWPRQGLSALQLELKLAAVNIVKTGAEGGISNACLYWGTTKDGRGILYWYSVDWIAINGKINVSNEVINGSNDPTNPLIYNQPGIDRLQDRLGATVVSAVTNGLATGQVVQTSLTGLQLDEAIASGQFNGQLVVNAVPFVPYLTANPNDYRTGTYDGLSVRYITAQGFISILITIVVTDFIAGT